MNYLNQLFNLTGKVAVITGGGGVLASEIGSGLSKAGVKIVFLDINEAAAQETAQKIVNQGGEAQGYKNNVLDIDDLKKLREEIVATFGKVDILLNAAGGNMPGATISPDKTIFDLDIKDLDKVTDLNFKGTVLPSMVFGEAMAKQGFGNIITLSFSNNCEMPVKARV
jgi:NAD(P)-dependent dehydrogenase (short-subunit alcohol dehydrogenase family)